MELAEKVVGFLQDLLHTRPAEISVFAQDDHSGEEDLVQLEAKWVISMVNNPIKREPLSGTMVNQLPLGDAHPSAW